MTYMALPQRSFNIVGDPLFAIFNPCPGDHEILHLGRLFLGYHYYIFCLSDLFLGVEKKIFKRYYAFSLYDLYDNTLVQVPLSQGHEIYNLGRPFLNYHYYILSFI